MFSLLGLTIFCLLNLASSQYNIYRQDPFALLSRTLLTYQKAACDGQVLDLVCPSGTKISIQLVQYGRTAPSSQVKKFVTEVTSDLLVITNDFFTTLALFYHYFSEKEPGRFRQKTTE